MSIAEHIVLNYNSKFEKQKIWNIRSKHQKLEEINKQLRDIRIKRQVILRDFSKRFTGEED